MISKTAPSANGIVNFVRIANTAHCLRYHLLVSLLHETQISAHSRIDLFTASLGKRSIFLPLPDVPKLFIPLGTVKVSAGFPSPAADYEDKRLDMTASKCSAQPTNLPSLSF
jgi:hypothetical protein